MALLLYVNSVKRCQLENILYISRPMKCLVMQVERNKLKSSVLQSIVFIRDKNARGQEISGYIDYAHRLKTEEFEPYFSGKKRLLPRPSDLRYVL